MPVGESRDAFSVPFEKVVVEHRWPVVLSGEAAAHYVHLIGVANQDWIANSPAVQDATAPAARIRRRPAAMVTAAGTPCAQADCAPGNRCCMQQRVVTR